MFIVENGLITGDKTFDIGEIRRVDFIFKFTDTAFDDDDKFQLDLGGNKFNLYGFTDAGCLRFTRCDLEEIITKAESNFSVSVLLNGTAILSDEITITAVIQGGEEIQGIVFNILPKYKTTQIKIIPSDITKDVTSFIDYFNDCRALTSIPSLDTSNGTNFRQMFQNCVKITTIPSLDTSNGTDFYRMFKNCVKITTIPSLDTSNGTDFQEMFCQCRNLTQIPSLDASNGTNFQEMFYGCSALTTISALDISNGTNFYNMFRDCSKLTSIPALDTSNGTNFSFMFAYCHALTSIPSLDTSNGTNFGSMFYGCSALTDFGGLLNVKLSFSLSTCNNLTHESLLNVLNGLYDLTGGTAQTLTLGSTNLAKLTDQEKAIATNKNWTLA